MTKTDGRVRLHLKAPLIYLRDQRGKLHQCHGPRMLPEWALWDDAQVKHLLDHDMVELVDAAGQPTDPGRVVECLSVICGLGLPQDAGRPRVAEALRREGFRYSNDAISKALRLFKSNWKVGDPCPWEPGGDA
jgi:hypothetical protein